MTCVFVEVPVVPLLEDDEDRPQDTAAVRRGAVSRCGS